MDSIPDQRKEPLTIAGKRYLVWDHLAGVIQICLALGSARTLGWYSAWLYGAVILVAKIGAAGILVRINPAVLNARGTRQTISMGDRAFLSVFVSMMLAIPVVAGVDVGSAGWTHRSTAELVIGLALLVFGSGIVTWALAVNAFFEPTVRIQRERDQKVCAAGPYQLVRHPGYVGAITATVGIPLLLGSRWCLLPVAVVTIAFVRTVLVKHVG